jgi:hypothetical protein
VLSSSEYRPIAENREKSYVGFFGRYEKIITGAYIIKKINSLLLNYVCY